MRGSAAMKIGIVGSGAMGSVYGALLADAGNELWLFDQWRDHVEAMRAGGLRCTGASGDRTVAVNATTDAADGGTVRARGGRDQGHAHRARGARGGADDRARDAGADDPERARQRRAPPARCSGPRTCCSASPAASAPRCAAPGHVHHNGMEAINLAELAGRHQPAARAGRRGLARGGLQGPDLRRPLAGALEQADRERRVQRDLRGDRHAGRPGARERGGLGDRLRLHRRGGGGRRGQGRAARLRRPGAVGLGLRRQDPGRAPLDVPGRARRPALGDRHDPGRRGQRRREARHPDADLRADGRSWSRRSRPSTRRHGDAYRAL